MGASFSTPETKGNAEVHNVQGSHTSYHYHSSVHYHSYCAYNHHLLLNLDIAQYKALQRATKAFRAKRYDHL